MEMQTELGLAVLFISHDLSVVSEIADDVMVMYAGRMVEHATSENLFRSPNHPYTRGLIETRPQASNLAQRLPTIAGHVPDLTQIQNGCAFEPRCLIAESECKSKIPILENGVACWNVTL
jgi:oligopeptide/dipeptide ABC transporter ATP-binding protein